jgi:N-acetylmuramoyl-L-alanine amidase
VLAVAAVLAAATLSAATAKSMYVDTLAREEAVRPVLNAAPDAQGDAAALKNVRAVIAAYEAIVRRYPASGYSDNALWQAGRLSLDAFARFGQPQDKAAGLRLLHSLASQYPGSKLARQVPGILMAEPFDSAQARQARPLPADAGNVRAVTGSVGAELARPEARPAHIATIKAVRREPLPDAVRVTIELDTEVPFHDERLADPARVFIDLPSARAAASLLDQTLRFDGDTDLVHQIRIGRHPNNTTRVVLDAAGVSSYNIYALYNPYRLVIDCARASATAAPVLAPMIAPAPVTASVLPLRAHALAADWPRRLPMLPLRAAAALSAASAAVFSEPTAHGPSAEPVHPEAPPLPPPTPAAPTTTPYTGGLSIARQLGLGVSRIVIDPGHGGHDPGTKARGVTEAELVLDVALRLEKLLLKISGVEVILTRRTDDFVPLPERTAIANREGADLFLSIHVNSSPSPEARGIETYFLNFANNQTEAAVAARENAESTQAMGALPDFVKAIALNNKLDESRDFATQVQRAMLEKLRQTNKGLKDRGVKQAPFVVLIGAAMPSVLAEISFVTNPQDAKLLKSSAYRQKIAEALLAAVRKYQTSLKSVTAVAHQ